MKDLDKLFEGFQMEQSAMKKIVIKVDFPADFPLDAIQKLRTMNPAYCEVVHRDGGCDIVSYWEAEK